MIPRILHFIWVGDEAKRPNNCIQSWIDHHPDWTIRIWDNADLAHYGWVNAKHMREMAPRELNGVADMMRWEILYNEGGIVIDADSICTRALEPWLLQTDAFACWENEVARPGLVAAGYVGATKENPFFGQMILDLQSQASVIEAMAWETVGPLFLTRSMHKYKYTGLTIYPSHYFIPEHFSGIKYEGSGQVFAHQEWASTRHSYDSLHLKEVALKEVA